MRKVVFLSLFMAFIPALVSAADDGLAERVANLEDKISQGWFDKVELSGAVEVEAGYVDSDGEKSSDVDMTTVELGVDVALTGTVSGFILMKWDGDEEGVYIDEGGITLGNIDENGATITVGKLYVPFGVFETAMVSDPLTLELGETREGAAVVDFAAQGFYGAVYAFNSEMDKDGDDDAVDAYGANVGYLFENDRLAVDVSAGYISNITSSGGFVDGLGTDTVDDYSAGATFSAIFSVADLTFAGEYMATLDSDYSASEDSEPTAWSLEAAYGFALKGHASTAAVTYQKSDEAAVLDLAETRYGVAFGYEVIEGLGMTVEYMRNENYDDTEEDALTCQLALEF